MTQLVQQLSQKFVDIILHLFLRQTSSCILILGRRESGKTDFSLLIAEILATKGIIKNFATNVKIYSSPFPVERITNLDDLRFWCENTRGKKLFILDEAGKSLRRRTPMSSLNVKLLDNLQILRKYKLSIIFIAPHEKYIDSAALGSDIVDAVFIKPNYKNPKIALYDDWMEGTTLTLTNIPRTSIKFDTWDVAPFTEHGPKQKPKFKDRDLEILWDWSHGATVKDLGLHPQQINRLCRKFIREVLEREHHASHTRAGGDIYPK